MGPRVGCPTRHPGAAFVRRSPDLRSATNLIPLGPSRMDRGFASSPLDLPPNPPSGPKPYPLGLGGGSFVRASSWIRPGEQRLQHARRSPTRKTMAANHQISVARHARIGHSPPAPRSAAKAAETLATGPAWGLLPVCFFVDPSGGSGRRGPRPDRRRRHLSQEP